MIKRLILVLIIVLVGVVLTGCNIIITTPGCCVPPVESCSLTVTAGYYVWGTIYYQVISTGQVINTGEYIDYSLVNQATISNVPCGTEIWVYIVDDCNYPSHVEPISLQPGENSLYFRYW